MGGYDASGTASGDSERNHLTSANWAYECDSSWVDGDGSGPGSVTQDDIGDGTTPGRCKKETYTKCYRGGSACPMGHSVCKVEYCELQRWREIVDLYHSIGCPEGTGIDHTVKRDNGMIEITRPRECSGSNVQVLGLIETKGSDGKTERSNGDIIKDIKAYTDHNTKVKGFYFNNAHGSSQAVIDGLMTIAHEEITSKDPSMFVVFGLGMPLLEKTALDKAGAWAPVTARVPVDVWVTVNTGQDNAGSRLGGDLGSWTPFSWYSYEPATTWSAMVTQVKADNVGKTNADGVTKTLDMMHDRGYGYVYLHSGANYNEMRGTPKPTWDASPERMAADCTVLPTLRDDQPTKQCMELYRTEDAPEVAEWPDFVDIVLDDADLTAGTVPIAIAAALALNL